VERRNKMDIIKIEFLDPGNRRWSLESLGGYMISLKGKGFETVYTVTNLNATAQLIRFAIMGYVNPHLKLTDNIKSMLRLLIKGEIV
jgi:hypothetical protein